MSDDLWLEAVVRHDVATGEQVVQLVGPADLDIGPDRDGVVRLHGRIEELGQRDRLARGEPLCEVVPLEQARDGQRARQPHRLGERQRREPLAVEAELGALRVEHAHDLLPEALGVRVQLVVREHGPLGRAAGGVADARGVVPDDEDDRVACVLPLPQPVEYDRETEMDVGRRRVDPELHTQGPALPELRLEAALRQHVHRMSRGNEVVHDSRSGSTSPAGSKPKTCPMNESVASSERTMFSSLRKPCPSPSYAM